MSSWFRAETFRLSKFVFTVLWNKSTIFRYNQGMLTTCISWPNALQALCLTLQGTESWQCTIQMLNTVGFHNHHNHFCLKCAISYFILLKPQVRLVFETNLLNLRQPRSFIILYKVHKRSVKHCLALRLLNVWSRRQSVRRLGVSSQKPWVFISFFGWIEMLTPPVALHSKKLTFKL